VKEIQIYEVAYTDNLFIVTDQNREANYYDKKNLTVEVDSDYIILRENGVVILRELPSSFIVPRESSAVDLVEILQGYLDNLVPELSNSGNVSLKNSSNEPLDDGETFTGESEEVYSYPSVTVAVKTDKDGILYVEFSADNVNWDSSLSFTVTESVNEVHRITITRRYLRTRFTNNSGGNQSYFRLQTIFGYQQALTSPLSSSIQSDADSIVSRSVLMIQRDNGHWVNVPGTAEGHLEVAIHDPKLPFNSIHTEKLTPIFQTDAVYGVNAGQNITTVSGSGTVTGTGNLITASTGTTIYSQAVVLGRKRLRYRAGQGIVGRFTAVYSAPAQNSYILAGFGTASDGVYFGYGNTADLTDTRFGILYVRGGVREVKTLTVTTKATVADNVTITLNTVPFTIAVTDATAGTLYKTVWDISQGTYAGWDAYPSGDTVIFIRKSAGTTAGSQSFSAGATGSAASIAQTKAGAASTDTFIAQEDWNGDVMDGSNSTSNPSGILLDPTKGNVFQIGIQYLGYGAINFDIETASDNSNNPIFSTVHTLKLPNTLTAPSFTNPSFPFTMAAYSAGSTTNVTVATASYAGFIEGSKILHGNRLSYFNAITTGNASTLTPIVSVMNTRYYNGKANQAVINLLSVSGAIKHTQPVVYYLIKGGALGGNPNFQQLSTISCSLWDTASTSVTYSTGDQLVWTGHLGETGELDHHFGNGEYNAEEVTLQPGEWVTLAVKSVANNIAHATGGINTREDQ